MRQQEAPRYDPAFAAAECTFTTLPGCVAYCNRLPRGRLALLRRLARVRAFPLELTGEAAPGV